ncbi:hypothetical protein PG984_002677 [Apiospora sp. TS-2023a]
MNYLLGGLIAAMSLAMSINAAPGPPRPLLQLPRRPRALPHVRGPLGHRHAAQAGRRAVHRLPGPKVCTRVACSMGAAVSFCNDQPFEIAAPCGNLSDYAQIILDKCKYSDARHEYVQGQLFDADDGDANRGWGNVVVGFDGTCS